MQNFAFLKLLKIYDFNFGVFWNVPILASSFWWENSNGVEVTKENLTIEKHLPLQGILDKNA